VNPKRFITVCLFIITSVTCLFAQAGRWEKELSGEGWKLWLDKTALWHDDDIYLPPVIIDKLPVNSPTCGWEKLDEMGTRKNVSVPGTVEEYFWSANGNKVGLAGDYRGVSWWSTTFEIDQNLKGKRISIYFESVNLRAEVFVNGKLVGYDVVGNTPFACDVSDAITFQGENRLDVRITDPVGTFSWDDTSLLRWGKNDVPSVHGFGGITGRIFLRAYDEIYIDDIYVQNKAKFKDAKKVDIFVAIANSSGMAQKGNLSLIIREWKNPSEILWEKRTVQSISHEGSNLSFNVHIPDATLWDIKKPYLYEVVVTYKGDNNQINDSMSRRFGFRSFDVGEKNGDKRFYLNGQRVFITAAMTRGFWPKNGIFPTPEMAKKDMETAMNMGFNMMLYHRAIGQLPSIEVADEMGMLTYEEPGGYLCYPGPDSIAKEWRREKLKRMILRDRSHPSMVIWDIEDLSSMFGMLKKPSEDDEKNVKMVRNLDPSRIITYNCVTVPTIPNDPDYPFKLHMLPFDNTFYYKGWTSPYHLVRYGGYLDEYYRNPRYYLRYVIDPIADMGDSINVLPKDEIIFLGEEGDIGAPLRLEKIKNELMRTGADGWRESEHLDWFESYDRFLDESGFRSSYPTVDDLTLALGKNMHYFHGRIIENVRISNKADAYVLNGWAPEGDTHTDFVDVYRNPTGDTSIFKYYTQPLYIAVKLRDKVMPSGASTMTDIFIVNEKNLHGDFTLDISLEDPSGAVVFSKDFKVKVLGGEEFGQLLVEGIRLPNVNAPGYYILKAIIRDKNNDIKTTGSDKIFVVDYLSGPGVKGTVSVIDSSGTINDFLEKTRGIKGVNFEPSGPDVDYIIIGEHDFGKIPRKVRGVDPVLDMVKNGSTLIVLDQADRWAGRLKDAMHYIGSNNLGKRGRLFVGKSSFLKDLPVEQAMDWEYQVFYRGRVWGLNMDMKGNETIAAIASEHTKDIITAVVKIPYGNGSIILSTLNILPELRSKTLQSSVAKKLFLNFLEYSK